jgi:hypothetical protein
LLRYGRLRASKRPVGINRCVSLRCEAPAAAR